MRRGGDGSIHKMNDMRTIVDMLNFHIKSKSEQKIMNMIHLLVTLIAVILNALTLVKESIPLYNQIGLSVSIVQ